MSANNTRAKQRCGATLVEAALVLSICLMFMLGIYEYGRYLMVENLLDNAAREGCRLAVVHTADYTTSQIQDAADAALAGQGTQQLQGYNKYSNITVFHADSSGNNIGTDWNNATFGQGVGVTISGTYQPLVPSFLKASTSFTVSSTIIMNSEAN